MSKTGRVRFARRSERPPLLGADLGVSAILKSTNKKNLNLNLLKGKFEPMSNKIDALPVAGKNYFILKERMNGLSGNLHTSDNAISRRF